MGKGSYKSLLVSMIFLFFVSGYIHPEGKENPTELKSSYTVKDIINNRMIFLENENAFYSRSPHKPVSADSDDLGNIYSIGSNSNNIITYHPDGRVTYFWSGNLSFIHGETFSQSSLIRVSDQDEVFVTLKSLRLVLRYNSEGNILKPLEIEKPVSSLSFDSKGNIFVSLEGGDKNGNLIHVFNRNGKLIRRFGEIKVTGKPDFFHESQIVHDEKDNLFQIFMYFPYIRKYTPDGKLVFEKEIKLHRINRKEGVFWSNYNFENPPNKTENGWMRFCSRADYFKGKIYVLKLASIFVISDKGKIIRFYREDDQITEITGYFRDLQIHRNSGELLIPTFFGHRISLGLYMR